MNGIKAAFGDDHGVEMVRQNVLRTHGPNDNGIISYVHHSKQKPTLIGFLAVYKVWKREKERESGGGWGVRGVVRTITPCGPGQHGKSESETNACIDEGVPQSV
jgi:hypothetical protein